MTSTTATEAEDCEGASADVEQDVPLVDTDATAITGPGLLGFSPRPLGPGDMAYFAALGLTEEQIRQVILDLRDGMSPLTRARNRNADRSTP
jgi:hypothetical protein